jgi:hypothetical protein
VIKKRTALITWAIPKVPGFMAHQTDHFSVFSVPFLALRAVAQESVQAVKSVVNFA